MHLKDIEVLQYAQEVVRTPMNRDVLSIYSFSSIVGTSGDRSDASSDEGIDVCCNFYLCFPIHEGM
jgi:hypothetical protein